MKIIDVCAILFICMLCTAQAKCPTRTEIKSLMKECMEKVDTSKQNPSCLSLCFAHVLQLFGESGSIDQERVKSILEECAQDHGPLLSKYMECLEKHGSSLKSTDGCSSYKDMSDCVRDDPHDH